METEKRQLAILYWHEAGGEYHHHRASIVEVETRYKPGHAAWDLVSRLRFSAQGDAKRDQTYGWAIKIDDTTDILRDGDEIGKLTRKLNSGLEKLRVDRGDPQDFSEWLLRIASILKIKWAYVPMKRPPEEFRTEVEHIQISLGDLAYQIRAEERTWAEKHMPAVADGQKETA